MVLGAKNPFNRKNEDINEDIPEDAGDGGAAAAPQPSPAAKPSPAGDARDDATVSPAPPAAAARPRPRAAFERGAADKLSARLAREEDAIKDKLRELSDALESLRMDRHSPKPSQVARQILTPLANRYAKALEIKTALRDAEQAGRRSDGRDIMDYLVHAADLNIAAAKDVIARGGSAGDVLAALQAAMKTPADAPAEQAERPAAAE